MKWMLLVRRHNTPWNVLLEGSPENVRILMNEIHALKMKFIILLIPIFPWTRDSYVINFFKS